MCNKLMGRKIGDHVEVRERGRLIARIESGEIFCLNCDYTVVVVPDVPLVERDRDRA